MAANVQLIEKNGPSGTATDKTGGTIRFKKSDNAAVDLSDPLVKPEAGSEWSFEKYLRLSVVGGSYTQITNIRVYSDGSNDMGAGINVWAKTAASYATPAQGSSSSGYQDFFSYTAGSPLVLGAGPYSGTGEQGDHLVLLCEVTSAATGGLTPAETLTLAWDEI